MINAPRSITLIVRGPNDFDVFEGERYSERMTWDEMLGQIASLTHALINGPRYPMKSPAEREERESRARTAGMRL